MLVEGQAGQARAHARASASIVATKMWGDFIASLEYHRVLIETLLVALLVVLNYRLVRVARMTAETARRDLLASHRPHLALTESEILYTGAGTVRVSFRLSERTPGVRTEILSVTTRMALLPDVEAATATKRFDIHPVLSSASQHPLTCGESLQVPGLANPEAHSAMALFAVAVEIRDADYPKDADKQETVSFSDIVFYDDDYGDFATPRSRLFPDHSPMQARRRELRRAARRKERASRGVTPDDTAAGP